MTQADESQANRLLKYSDDARLLIINADDFGRSHASNEATFRALKAGVVSSTTLMVPCPWALHAMQLLSEHPDIAFGVHLTVVCDVPHYRCRPLTSRDKVPSLVDESGFFYATERIPEWLAQLKLGELEVEFRAQIEAVLAASLRSTHLDWHCLYNGGRADIFEMTVKLAKEYGLAMRVFDPAAGEGLRRQGLPSNDHNVLDSYSLDIAEKSALYARALRELPQGLSEWAVHPALDTPEMQAIEPQSWRVRVTDFDFLISSQAHEIIEQEGIVLLSYKPLQKAWQERKPGSETSR
ncbi:ChbG/HpnK family deacetylase [Ktedonosporobacter rubrisoli]|uniref:ChbG/HpnK family deacetylase n=1 Tax=Ktedonosporobacter rubrisoli TaxID=2509675 RepID=A0A4P6JLB4_KTERU|nr:polysaccharide deacetylase family protein [Ktedonosporobacter rubrisoli]QBD75974.1 ChbG/HpnK family deacetylase [Ktedonosporobacter rubrisoli]